MQPYLVVVVVYVIFVLQAGWETGGKGHIVDGEKKNGAINTNTNKDKLKKNNKQKRKMLMIFTGSFWDVRKIAVVVWCIAEKKIIFTICVQFHCVVYIKIVGFVYKV